MYDDDYDLDFYIDDEDEDDCENYDHLWNIGDDDYLYIDTYYNEDGDDDN